MPANRITDFIGNTPLVRSQNIFKSDTVTLLFKLESSNPGGSVKDRAAYWMISQAMKRGDISRDDTLIEASSGNTGIALSLMARVMGLNMIITMPENATVERIKIMKAYGAKVILTNASEGMEGAIDLAIELSQNQGYFRLNQFDNDDNPKAHFHTTGPEIWRDTSGTITHFVATMGTTGTITGVSDFLKSKEESIQIIGVQPKDGSKIPGIRKWSKDYLPGIYNSEKVDKIMEVSDIEAKQMTVRLAKEEGIFAGISSGGSVSTAVKIANSIDKGVVVAIICDRGDRYLSSDVF